MLLSSLAIFVAALPLTVLGGEFPAHNGVVGGAPINLTVAQGFPKTLVEYLSVEAGRLRYVENSGVCGRAPLLKSLPALVLITRQKPPPGSTQLQATQT